MGSLLAFVAVLVVAGALLRVTRLVRAEAAHDLTAVVFHLTLPCLAFRALHDAPWSPALLWLPATALGVVAVGLAVGGAIARALRLPPARGAAMALVLAFGNTTFFGYPMVQALLGERHLVEAILFDQLGTTLAVNTVGAAIAAAAGGEKVAPTALLRRILTFPPFLALVGGLALRAVPLPPVLDALLGQVGALTTPIIVLTIGLSLRFEGLRHNPVLVAFATVWHLVLLPAAAWVTLRGLGAPRTVVPVSVLQAGMPAMFYVLALTLRDGLDAELVVNVILATVVGCFATLPAWAWWVTR